MSSHEAIEHAHDADFEEKIKHGVALVDFFADWCGPCRVLAPIFEQVAGEMHQQARFLKVNTDDAQKTASSYRITSIPTLILFKDGKEMSRVVGIRDAEGLRTLVSSAL